ncbi:MAG: hypothetical protein QME79_12560 [Bacillota bacterium]|nr:hypothetical protein [Bacillota bacterium]
MGRVLNLDEFVPEPSSVTFQGRSYKVADVEVETFLRLLKLSDELQGADDYETILEKVVELVHQAVPEMPEATIRKLNLPQIFRLLEFVVEELQKDPNVRKAMSRAKSR